MASTLLAPGRVAFDALTVAELDELTDRLCNAIAAQRRIVGAPLAAELRDVEHDAWHVRCALAGVRCLQDKS